MSEGNFNVEEEISEALLERPCGFSVDGKWFYLYPVTLGLSILLSRLIQKLEIDQKLLSINPSLETLRVIRLHKDVACRILAFCTAEDRSAIFDVERIDCRQAHFAKHLSDNEIAQLLLLIYQYDKAPAFIKHLGLDREQKEQAKISRLKNKDGNTVMFGGKSIYGSLISVACEKYGWTLDYVVWGVSLVNLRMLLADSVTSVYLSEVERKSAKVTTGQEIVNMDNPANWAKIKSMKWD